MRGDQQHKEASISEGTSHEASGTDDSERSRKKQEQQRSEGEKDTGMMVEPIIKQMQESSWGRGDYKSYSPYHSSSDKSTKRLLIDNKVIGGGIGEQVGDAIDESTKGTIEYYKYMIVRNSVGIPITSDRDDGHPPHIHPINAISPLYPPTIRAQKGELSGANYYTSQQGGLKVFDYREFLDQ